MTILAPALLALSLAPALAEDPLPDRPGHVKSAENPFSSAPPRPAPAAGSPGGTPPEASPAASPARTAPQGAAAPSAAEPARSVEPAPPAAVPPPPAAPPAAASLVPPARAPRPETLVGAGALGPGAIAVLAAVGYPWIAVTYAQGTSPEDDLGARLRLDWTDGEMLLGVDWRRELSRRGEARTGFRLVAGPWFDFGGTWIYSENRSNLGLQAVPGIAWTTAAGTGLFTVSGDVAFTWAWQRGMGLAMAPALGVAYEVPVLPDMTIGARAELTIRWASGSAQIPGLDRRIGAGLAALATWRAF